jgi:hypothetical protein
MTQALVDYARQGAQGQAPTKDIPSDDKLYTYK